MTSQFADFQLKRYLAPRFWPTWLGLGAMWLAAQLPYSAQLWLGRQVGTVAFHLLKKKRRVAEINIALCFPERSEAEQAQLVKETFHSVGCGIIEAGFSWWGSDRRLRALAHIEGVEHVNNAFAEGKGVLLLGAHYTSLLMCGRLMAFEVPFYAVAKRAHNPLFDSVLNHYRRKHFAGLINHTNMRAMLKALKSNKACWYAPDQDLGYESTIFAPFMGVTAATLTATARIARVTHCAVIPIDFERLPGRQGYRVRFRPPIEAFPSGDEVRDATTINAAIEEQVRRAPSQYLWIHRRFKSQPDRRSPYE
ncbi:MAG TPA: LpxL/LpxP family Kdo(2)-lipid IV(A) lauroyl/palmitoleoyl acyltransferase [Chromatiales bacterium]|nr:LpxL/LpxP family Kdo(2)-lipid IV(A) lauroyl/palmitoleoyl acyltransferase [Chromatiales bacterium]